MDINKRIKEMEDKNKALMKELEDFKKELHILNEVHSNKKWEPKNGDIVYVIHGDGDVYDVKFNEAGMSQYFKHGRVFRTRAEAEFFSERELVRAELEAFADDNQEWDITKTHSYIYWDTNCKTISTASRNVVMCDIPHFKTQESAQLAVDVVGAKRIKKYLFGVE